MAKHRTIGDMIEDGGEQERNRILGMKKSTVIAIVVGLLVICCIGGPIVGFANNWFRTGVEVISPENVKKQWQNAYDRKEALNASARNWCTAKRAEDNSTTDDERAQRVSQTAAIEQNFSKIQAQYDAAIQDGFRAKYVLPSDGSLPARAPTLEATVKELGCYTSTRSS